jgi:hypothetical protein
MFFPHFKIFSEILSISWIGDNVVTRQIIKHKAVQRSLLFLHIYIMVSQVVKG